MKKFKLLFSIIALSSSLGVMISCIFLWLTMNGCDPFSNKPKSLLTPAEEAYWDSIPEKKTDIFTQHQFDSAYIANSTIKLEDLKKSSTIIPYEKMVFLFRIPAKDPEGKRLIFTLLIQPIRGMFYVNEDGDMYITSSYLEKIQQWNGKTFDVIVAVSDGENASKATMSFTVEKSPDGKHYLKKMLNTV